MLKLPSLYMLMRYFSCFNTILIFLCTTISVFRLSYVFLLLMYKLSAVLLSSGELILFSRGSRMSVSMFGSHVWELYLSFESYVVWTFLLHHSSYDLYPVRIQWEIQDERPTISTQELGKKISSRQKRRETAPQGEELEKRERRRERKKKGHGMPGRRAEKAVMSRTRSPYSVEQHRKVPLPHRGERSQQRLQNRAKARWNPG